MQHFRFLGLLYSLLPLVTGCAGLPGKGPIGFWSRNRYHSADKLRHGPWREYFDASEQHVANRGRYRHGLPVGRWYYYAPGGALERKEQFHHKPEGLVTISYYHPTGQLAKQGQARYQMNDQSVRFFWFGEWRCYTVTGQPLPSEYYRNGRQTTSLITTPAGDSVAWPTTR